MDKAYNHKNEEKIYKIWEKANAFSPDNTKSKKSFCIIMPPPNANDPLHIGHAREVSTQDILVRYHRMKGEKTLWLPGADHAGIETQYVFEKKLSKEGKSRFNYDRETFYQMVWDYVQENRGTMENQLKRLGASCDWERNTFTLDPKIIKIVYETFKNLYDDGLIYRGERMVNYCPECGTAYSELEVDHNEQDDEIYHLDYKTIKIATTRPETIFADVAIAVNPKDKRYKNLIGKTAIIPIINRAIPIIADNAVEMEFGTGALKVTPAHDPTDYEIGQRNKLPLVSVIDENGKMINTPSKYAGLKVAIARQKVVADLEKEKALLKTEKIHHTVSICYRCKGTIEPTISKQWFLKVKPLVQESVKAIKEKEVKFVAKKYEKIAMHWYKNLKDWNISRQIVWGIRIPAYRCNKCMEWTITNGDTPQKCDHCKHDVLTQDIDTFDTWFSSGQWPFATLMANKKNDFKDFYPTNVMDPSYDILPFWIIRMIMLGIYKTKKVPFKDVLLHGLVRDKFGVKISKSKGNVIDPMEMIDKYGADALRNALVWGILVENDNSLSEENIRGQRNFANKLWNIARFITNDQKINNYSKKPKITKKEDKEILQQLSKAQTKITTALDKYKLNEATETLYNFIWNDLANSYLESTKSYKEEAQATLNYVLYKTIILAHPFMPFVTESIWQECFLDNKTPLMLQNWK